MNVTFRGEANGEYEELENTNFSLPRWKLEIWQRNGNLDRDLNRTPSYSHLSFKNRFSVFWNFFNFFLLAKVQLEKNPQRNLFSKSFSFFCSTLFLFPKVNKRNIYEGDFGLEDIRKKWLETQTRPIYQFEIQKCFQQRKKTLFQKNLPYLRKGKKGYGWDEIGFFWC